MGLVGRLPMSYSYSASRYSYSYSIRYPGGSLDQSSQHRYDPLQIAFFRVHWFIVNRIAYPQDIMNRSTFQ